MQFYRPGVQILLLQKLPVTIYVHIHVIVNQSKCMFTLFFLHHSRSYDFKTQSWWMYPVFLMVAMIENQSNGFFSDNYSNYMTTQFLHWILLCLTCRPHCQGNWCSPQRWHPSKASGKERWGRASSSLPVFPMDTRGGSA